MWQKMIELISYFHCIITKIAPAKAALSNALKMILNSFMSTHFV